VTSPQFSCYPTERGFQFEAYYETIDSYIDGISTNCVIVQLANNHAMRQPTVRLWKQNDKPSPPTHFGVPF
jgi:hypothetical protein